MSVFWGGLRLPFPKRSSLRWMSIYILIYITKDMHACGWLLSTRYCTTGTSTPQLQVL